MYACIHADSLTFKHTDASTLSTHRTTCEGSSESPSVASGIGNGCAPNFHLETVIVESQLTTGSRTEATGAITCSGLGIVMLGGARVSGSYDMAMGVASCPAWLAHASRRTRSFRHRTSVERTHLTIAILHSVSTSTPPPPEEADSFCLLRGSGDRRPSTLCHGPIPVV